MLLQELDRTSPKVDQEVRIETISSGIIHINDERLCFRISPYIDKWLQFDLDK